MKGFIPTELWRFVSNIGTPTIYIIGGGGNIVPLATQERLKQTLPNVQMVAMPEPGHYPHLEAPEAYLRIVEAFLSGPPSCLIS